MIFTQINMRTKKFKSSLTNYKYEDKIKSLAKNTIIINSKSENIHPSLWCSEWFLDQKEAQEYIKSIKNGEWKKQNINFNCKLSAKGVKHNDK